MKKATVSVLLVAAFSTGCVAASGPPSLPDRLHYSRLANAHVDVGSVSSAAELFGMLPRVLSRYGYFLTNNHEQETPYGYQFVTDWHVTRSAGDSFESVQQTRTRLVIDARRRGTRYALTVYAVSYVEDAEGKWHEIPASRAIESQVRDIGKSMWMELR